MKSIGSNVSAQVDFLNTEVESFCNMECCRCFIFFIQVYMSDDGRIDY